MDFKKWLKNEETSIPVTMYRTPSQNTTQQNMAAWLVNASAQSTLMPKELQKNTPISYQDLIPTAFQQSADAVEMKVPYKTSRPYDDQYPDTSAARKEVLDAVEKMPQVQGFIKNGQLDPQNITINHTGVKDEKTRYPVFHIRFSINPPNSIRIPTYGGQRTKYANV